jgi:hypothetical protein
MESIFSVSTAAGRAVSEWRMSESEVLWRSGAGCIPQPILQNQGTGSQADHPEV